MSSPQRTEGATTPEVRALQETLAAEHAAVFVYGVLGARTSRSAAPDAAARLVGAYQVHQQRRDDLLAMIRAAGAEPEPPEPGYASGKVATPEEIRRRAATLEADCARTYAYLVANATDTTRRWATEALLDAAVRGLGFGAEPEPFPGV